MTVRLTFYYKIKILVFHHRDVINLTCILGIVRLSEPPNLAGFDPPTKWER